MAAGIRIDINLTHYAQMVERYPECLNRLTDLVGQAVEDAIYAHAKEEIHEHCIAVISRSIVSRQSYPGLGPPWTPQNGSVYGDTETSTVDGEYGMWRIGAYDDGANHIVVKANFS